MKRRLKHSQSSNGFNNFDYDYVKLDNDTVFRITIEKSNKYFEMVMIYS